MCESAGGIGDASEPRERGEDRGILATGRVGTPSGGPSRRNELIDDLWYKNAVIYCLDVAKYVDGDNDGIGDFAGLTRRLDYLAGLGVTCLWLQPFYDSPNRDNGYDVSNYYSVH